MAIGVEDSLHGESDSIRRTVRKAVDGGLSFVICTHNSGDSHKETSEAGIGERLVGQIIKGRRNDIVIALRVGGRLGKVDASRRNILQSVENSLRRMGSEWIDLCMLQGTDPLTPWEEQFRALERLLQQGKILYTGICNYQGWQVAAALGLQQLLNMQKLTALQTPYNLLNRGAESEILPMARFSGVGIIASNPLAHGLLTGGYEPGGEPPAGSSWSKQRDRLDQEMHGPASDVISELKAVAQERGLTPAQAATAWALSAKEVNCVVCDAGDQESLEALTNLPRITFEPRERERLHRPSAGLRISPN